MRALLLILALAAVLFGLMACTAFDNALASAGVVVDTDGDGQPDGIRNLATGEIEPIPDYGPAGATAANVARQALAAALTAAGETPYGQTAKTVWTGVAGAATSALAGYYALKKSKAAKAAAAQAQAVETQAAADAELSKFLVTAFEGVRQTVPEAKAALTAQIQALAARSGVSESDVRDFVNEKKQQA